MSLRLFQLNGPTSVQFGGKYAQAHAIDHRGDFRFHALGSSAAIVPSRCSVIWRALALSKKGLEYALAASYPRRVLAVERFHWQLDMGVLKKYASSLKRKKRPAATPQSGRFYSTLMTRVAATSMTLLAAAEN